MVVKGFKATSVFGYLDFDIKFNQDVSFLVGSNGSGKTTALRLMNALINPNIKELLQIPFEYCALEINTGKKDITISALTKNKKIQFNISDIKETLTLPKIDDSEFDYLLNRDEKVDELISDLKRKNAEHPVIRSISKIPSPIFLGLDRRREISDIKQDYFHEREIWLHHKMNKRIGNGKRFIKGSIGASLMDTEMLIQNSYRQIRELENMQSHRLRDKILLSSFQFSKYKNDDLTWDINKWKEKDRLLTRKKEINDAILNIMGKDSSLSNEVDKFFYEMTNLFEMMDQSKDGLVIEWLLNKAQIERMASIVDIIDEHKSRVDNYYQPINDFLNTVNDFYSDSNKRLEIDAVGQLIVLRPDGNKSTIEGLSSGERQLLVIFAHTFFNRNNGYRNIFIIDEPELSLHLGWQEKFSETIFSVSPNSQFILATHSPEIVAGNKHKSVKCK
ncbi:AAA family ATPase [Plesiomonas shigelloides]|uniref:AAA family ATPase n=1 Tax=Plesiomonas shigelloides TaxID=703 RepID=UPI0012621023|nr:AAA family ATPase [Plesiomonas shigelloides]KAB7711054.1 AAA family ATPase [Plesiomonas shigelloides]